MTVKKEVHGFGDALLNFNKKVGIAAIADSVAKLAGYEDCGCAERAEPLNNPDLLINKVFFKKIDQDEKSDT